MYTQHSPIHSHMHRPNKYRSLTVHSCHPVLHSMMQIPPQINPLKRNPCNHHHNSTTPEHQSYHSIVRKLPAKNIYSMLVHWVFDQLANRSSSSPRTCS